MIDKNEVLPILRMLETTKKWFGVVSVYSKTIFQEGFCLFIGCKFYSQKATTSITL